MKRIRYWEIYDVAARASDPDDAWVAGFPERYGITIPEMLWLIEETSGANSPTLKSLCRSHGLKKLGHESHWHHEIVWRIRRLVRKVVIDAKPVPIGEGISPDAPPQEPPTRAPQPDPETGRSAARAKRSTAVELAAAPPTTGRGTTTKASSRV